VSKRKLPQHLGHQFKGAWEPKTILIINHNLFNLLAKFAILVLDLLKTQPLPIMQMRGWPHVSANREMSPRVNRKFVRYPVNWEVISFNGRPVVETSLLDISAIGARIEGSQPLAPRNHVEFTYARGGDEQVRSHTGVVMWMRPLVHKPGRYQMGVKFFATDWSLDQELRNLRNF
jgi:hypothetical protein